MAQRRQLHQLPSETLFGIEQRIESLERHQLFEEAYALRMEMAEWLLAGPEAADPLLTVRALLRRRSPEAGPLPQT
ncbi:hypothetical protein KBY76_05190 [Synechococcus sp. GreenBA-s]|nr:hypothetical protein [Synechococcus sp. GreenBA-s]